MSPIYIYIQSPIWAAPYIYTPLTGLGQWHEQRRTTHSYSYNLSWSCTTSLASSCNWSCNQVYSHNKSCQWSGEVVQLSYDRRNPTISYDNEGPPAICPQTIARPSHDNWRLGCDRMRLLQSQPGCCTWSTTSLRLILVVRISKTNHD